MKLTTEILVFASYDYVNKLGSRGFLW